MSEAQPLITPPPALGPPIIGTDPSSAAGIPQPVFAGGSATVPATPIAITGTPILPPPQVGFGENALASPEAITPAPVPPSVAGYPQPQYATGSGTTPTAASLFPAFTAAGPSPPIIYSATQPPPPVPLPLPTTPGTQPIIISTAANIPQLPWIAVPWPVNTALPTISGTAVVGDTLTAAPGTWTNSPTYAYQWTNDGKPISGATASTYVLQSTDNGATVAVSVTATNASGSTTAHSAGVAVTITTARAAPHRPPPPLRRH